MKRSSAAAKEATESTTKPRIKRVRKVEEYLEPIEPTTKETESDAFEDEALNEVDALIEQIEDEQAGDTYIRVDRLPDFSATGRWGRNARAEFCGEIPTSRNYLSICQGLYGAGDYRFVLCEGNGQIVKRWPKRIAAPAAPHTFQNGTGQYPAGPRTIFLQQPAQNPSASQATAPVVAATPLDELKRLGDMATEFERLKKVLGVKEPGAAAPATPEPNGEQPTMMERASARVLEKAIDYAFETKNEARISEIVDSALGRDREPEPTWSGVVMELTREVLKPLAPVAAQLAAHFLIGNNPQQQPPAADPQPDLPPVTAIAPTSVPLDDWAKLLRRIIGYFQNGLPVDIPAIDIEHYADQHPSEADKLNALATGEAVQVAQGIIAAAVPPQMQGQINQPLFANYITAVQQALMEEGEEAAKDEVTTES